MVRICACVCMLLNGEHCGAPTMFSCMSAARLRRTWFGRTSLSCWPRCSCVSMTTAGLSATVNILCVPTNTVVYNRVYLVCNFIIATWRHVLVQNSYAVDPRRAAKFAAVFQHRASPVEISCSAFPRNQSE